jgi:hypothetical protein
MLDEQQWRSAPVRSRASSTTPGSPGRIRAAAIGRPSPNEAGRCENPNKREHGEVQTNPSAAASERTQLPAESTNEPERPANANEPEGGGIRTAATSGVIPNEPERPGRANEPEPTGVRTNATPPDCRTNLGAVGSNRTQAGEDGAACDAQAVGTRTNLSAADCVGFGAVEIRPAGRGRGPVPSGRAERIRGAVPRPGVS